MPYNTYICYILIGSCPLGAAWVDKAYRNDSAHQQTECSNAGLCDYDSGRCECFEGFSGAACQRSSCPKACNDRGVCMNMREMSIYHGPDYLGSIGSGDGRGVEYNNWDAEAVMMCRCDPPYFGADCSQSIFIIYPLIIIFTCIYLLFCFYSHVSKR